MIVSGPPPAPPSIEQPVPYAVSYGVVRGEAAPGARFLIVRVDGRVVRSISLESRRFVVDLDLPAGERTVKVETIDARGRRSGRTVRHVFGLPRAARPRERSPRLDGALQREVRRLARGFGSTSGIYVQSLTTGAGAAWNDRATFPAASTLKLAIAVMALARTERTPAHGSALDGLFRRMLTVSDNAAANVLEAVVGGSTSGGSALVNETMRSIGLHDTEMYGGYIVGTELGPLRALAAAIPSGVADQPWWGRGKKTTAFDLAHLARAVWLASGGRGALRAQQPGFTAGDARYLLYLLAHVRDTRKLDRRVRALPGVAVLHKAGWIDAARHDNGLVFWRGGVFVATVMTYRGTAAAADELAGRVAAVSLARFRR